MVYKWYILPIEGLYATYHLLREPETTIDPSQLTWLTMETWVGLLKMYSLLKNGEDCSKCHVSFTGMSLRGIGVPCLKGGNWYECMNTATFIFGGGQDTFDIG